MGLSLKKFSAVLLAALTAAVTGLLMGGCGVRRPEPFQYTDTAMGTVVRQTLYAPDKKTADSAADGVMQLLDRLEGQELSWRLEGSELYAVNAAAGSAGGYLMSTEMTGVIEECLRLGQESEGAFDVTLGAVVRLWDIDGWTAGGQAGDISLPEGIPLPEGFSSPEGFSLPEPSLLRQALDKCGYEKLVLHPEALDENGELLQARIFLPEGLQLDLGAVGKGVALDRLLDGLADSGISGAAISVGGSVLTYGSKPDHTDWKVGILNPRDTSEYIGILSLKGQWCVSTSGDYERYVEVDGVRYHHIMDPATGMPADSGVRSVTILSKDGLAGDALSTACFVLGAGKGMELARRYGAEALFVTGEGEIVMTEGMESCFSPAG